MAAHRKADLSSCCLLPLLFEYISLYLPVKMSLRASRGGRSGHTHAATVVEEDTPTLTPAQPFRRTRSQALRDEAEQQQQQQQQPASSSDVPASAIPQEEDPNLRTPKKRATRTSIAAAASAAAARLGKLSPVTVSPSLRMRTIEMVDSVAAACEKYQLLAFDAVPEWLRDNKYIRRGYRANLGWRHSFESVCHLHNEVGSQWTTQLRISRVVN
jgi:hypothetical protein